MKNDTTLPIYPDISMLRNNHNGRNISIRSVQLALSFLFFPSSAFALDMEYHCYNGFDPIVTAFQKVALIFGANDYRGLFFSMAVVGVMFGGMFVYLKVFMGGRLSLGAWATPFFLGVILYLGLMVPTGNLTIQDDVLNRFQIVQGVPDGIVALAGVTNLIERSIIEIIDLVNAPNSPNYKESAGGIGFDLLMSATGGDISGKTPDAYMTASLDRYIRDCVTFEIQRPGS
jgi:conjugal transfer mating pair stabilization protein TraG